MASVGNLRGVRSLPCLMQASLGRCAAACMAICMLLGATEAMAQDAAALRARHEALRNELANNPFQRPLHMESTQQGDELAGHAFAVIDQPFAVVAQGLRSPEHWCDILMLHLDVKGCIASGGAGQAGKLSVATTRKYDQPLSSAHWVDFDFQPEAGAASAPSAGTPPHGALAGSDYLLVRLHAEIGPMSTHNYRIVFEAIPLDARRSFVHLSFAYETGFAARLAMEGYFATFGRNKVGFSIIDTRPDGKPVYVANVRGLMERNTMRYYLAIDAFLSASALPAAEQRERRLRDWFDSAERYPLQLHEMSREEYLSMKRREMESAPAARPG